MEGFWSEQQRWSRSSFTTLETELTDELERLRWSRRELNPRSEESAADSEEDPDLPQAGDSEGAPEDSHEVAETDDDPRSQRGPSQAAERTDKPEVTGSEPPG